MCKIIKKSCKVLAVISILIFLSGTAFANGLGSQYKSQASGSFSSSVIDSDGDGIPGVIGFLQGQSTFGSITIHFFSEFNLGAAAPSGNCPADYVELPVVNSKTIHRHRNGDLLFLETTSETFCANPETGEFIWEETLSVIGGTGRFARAVGSLESSGTGVLLISDQAGVTSFGGVFLSNEGKIMLNGKQL